MNSLGAPVLAREGRRSTEEIEVVASDRVEEVDAALAVLHDGFVEAGFMHPRPSGRRLHPSYLNPGTVVVVARAEGEVIGTCMLIADGPFGLPSDRAFAEENDAMRAEGRGLLAECGSLAVAAGARRHTRRAITHMVAAIVRTGLASFPRSPVPLAVTPENVRFYETLAGARAVSEPRPLYGAPAVLMRTSGLEVIEHCAQGRTPIARSLHALITERDPSWLHDLRSGLPLPDEYRARLLAEAGVTQRLAAQQALAGDVAVPPLRRHPATNPVAA